MARIWGPPASGPSVGQIGVHLGGIREAGRVDRADADAQVRCALLVGGLDFGQFEVAVGDQAVESVAVAGHVGGIRVVYRRRMTPRAGVGPVSTRLSDVDFGDLIPLSQPIDKVGRHPRLHSRTVLRKI